MKLYNKSGHGLSHSILDKGTTKHFFIANGSIGEVPESVAKIWLKFAGVEEYISPEELAELKKENEELKKTAKKK